jgi:branched-subunit amino acid ABC-type transport system permease component
MVIAGAACKRASYSTHTRAGLMSVLNLLPHIVNGIALGLLFGLIALGFMLILGLMEQINLAHGSLFALGAYFAYAITTPWLPLPPEMLCCRVGRVCRSSGALPRRCYWRQSWWRHSGSCLSA